MVEQIKNNYIFYNKEHPIHIREYYLYVVDLFKKWLQINNTATNIILGDYDYVFNNSNKTLKIDIQCEHTLVLEGGRSVENNIFGETVYDNKRYLVRIDKYDYFNSLDYVIEYSLPNIENIIASKKFDTYIDKNIYIAPLFYNINFGNINNKNNIIGIFNRYTNARREDILKELNNKSINYKIIEDCFDKNDLFHEYQNSKIIVNIHQTEHHHTFEELRVLPALCNGVIIISEDCPLKEKIPYSKYIIWCKYNEISETVKTVNEKYEQYYQEIFINSDLKNILTNMYKNNKFKNESSIINSWLS
jgi:hypothetical protein